MSIFGSLQQQINALPAPAAPAAARRGLFGRPGPDLGRALTFLTQGTGGLDRQRAISAQETQARMAEQQRAQREAYAATIQDPRERQVFLTAPDEWAKRNAERYAPQVVGGGAAQVIDGMRTVEQPTFSESGDQVLERSSMGVKPIYTRTQPSITERIQQQNADTTRFGALTGRYSAEQQAALGRDRLALDQGNAGFTLGQDQTRYGPDGQPLASATPPPGQNPDDQRAQMADNLSTGLRGARRYVESAGVWSAYNPLQRQNRANLEAQLDSLKGNITFDRLMEMKRNSPNGASGLGAMSDNEARMLASTVAALNADMSPQELQRSFEVIDRLVTEMRQPQSGQPQAAPQGQGNVSREAAIAELRRRGLIQ